MSDLELFELVLTVRDAEASGRFYAEVVGLEPIGDFGLGWASFWVGDKAGNRWLGLRQGTLLYEEHSPLPEGNRFGPVHFAFKLPESEMEKALERLRAHGVEVLGPERWGPGRFEGTSYYFYDLDANMLEFWFPSRAPGPSPERV